MVANQQQMVPATGTDQKASTLLTGSVSDGGRAGALLKEAAKRCHLVSPATSCGALPEGCEIAFSSVLVDVQNETYDVGQGKRGLGKTALDRIAAAAGVSWDPDRCRRLDDGSDPRYVLFCAIGTVRQFDGSVLTISGTKEMDLRPGSPQIESLEAKARAKGKSADAQIREMRLHAVAHAESKAKLRAIRSLGIRSSYAPAELAKAFVIARLTFSGRTADPELRRAFAMERAKAMLSGSRALYGSAPAPSMRLAAPVPPPPFGSGEDSDDEPIELGEPVGEPVAPEPPATGVG